tara:strand:- start:80 stop:268 length:189 start_codon:yes stop_codon:yes gene_type:complete
MTEKPWTITFRCPDWLEEEVTLTATSKQMLEATRNQDFYELIEGSWVESALVSYGEGQQDQQ